MQPFDPIADPHPKPCKICTSPSPLFGVVDFHKSCLEQQGRHLPLSGHPIYYRRCPNCAFVFTTAFDHWTMADFHLHIYNESYLQVDPDYVQLRPLGNAHLIANTFRAAPPLQILDFGGGAGLLAETLRNQHIAASTYDPFSTFNQLPTTRFDLITCFEVLEHLPAPHQTIATLVSLLKDPGILLFSTLVQPSNFNQINLNWWYAAPRNGHVSLFSRPALARLFEPHNMKVASFSDNLHLAYAHLPPFAAHLVA